MLLLLGGVVQKTYWEGSEEMGELAFTKNGHESASIAPHALVDASLTNALHPCYRQGRCGLRGVFARRTTFVLSRL